ncbi:hypothetical protein B9Z55_012428 [Caenorhabditis nigoni]|uniref:DUF19 domain-containing protein n=1 Tax=Caenorhabditis nigoni TaxID=1611254 RepID=A0A2G5TY80_9PELO|nr:hypothetical protein B9Z55_012428 [Caenorhabditis nigoni]
MRLIFIALFCSFVFGVYGFPNSVERCHRELYVIEQCFEAFPFSSKNWEAQDFYEDLENYDSWRTCVSPSKCSESLRRIEKVKYSFELHKFYADNLQECLGSGVLGNLSQTCNQDCNPLAYLN